MTKDEMAFELTKLLIEKNFYGDISRKNETAEEYNIMCANSVAAMFNTFRDALKAD